MIKNMNNGTIKTIIKIYKASMIEFYMETKTIYKVSFRYIRYA